MTADPDEILRLERIGLATWPALDDKRIGNWELRAAEGITSRSNSVSPLGSPDGEVEQAVADCERWYAEHGLRPRFRLTSLAPPGLDDLLAARGYATDPAVDVMIRRLNPLAVPPAVDIAARPSSAWLAALMQRRFDEATPPSAVRAMLDRLAVPTAYAAHRNDAQIAAMGMGVVFDGHVAIYTMHTLAAQRRRGLGTDILQALLAWGQHHGAATGFLQVHSENTAGYRFYANHGFSPRYRYWYRVG